MTYYNMKNYKSHLFYIKLSKLFVKPDLSFHLKSSRKFISRKFISRKFISRKFISL